MAKPLPFGFDDAVRELRQQRLKGTRIEHDQDAILQACEAVQRRPQTHIEPPTPRAQLLPTFGDAVRVLRQHRLKGAQVVHAKDTFKEAYLLAKQRSFDMSIARGSFVLYDAVHVEGVGVFDFLL